MRCLTILAFNAPKARQLRSVVTHLVNSLIGYEFSNSLVSLKFKSSTELAAETSTSGVRQQTRYENLLAFDA